MKISLSRDSLKYATTVFDVIRIFLPNLSWQELTSENIYVDHVLLITVENTQVIVGFLEGEKIKEKIYSQEENEIKRTIKLTIYRFFTEVLEYELSPWGILTGIRPTKIVHRYWDQGCTRENIKEILAEKFFLASEKIQKLIEITHLQRKYLLEQTQAKKTVSVYISIPFCPTRCSYCSFPSFSVSHETAITEYLEQLLQEIKGVGEALKQANINIQTIYVGGGTPTTLNCEQLALLLEAIKVYLLSENTIEYTFEAGRPDTIDENKLLLLKEYNVDRISINPQTMWKKTLHKIGRLHTPQDIIEKYTLARKLGFAKINMDLIIGLPGEGLKEIEYTLAEIAKIKPENLTIHALAIKRTAKLREKNDNEPMFENQVQAMFNYTEQWCAKNGYLPYYLYRQKKILGNLENVGYSIGEQPCIYNIQMMEERQTIWGLGVGAGTKMVNPEDWTLVNTYNPKDLNVYKQRIKEIIRAKVDKIQPLG